MFGLQLLVQCIDFRYISDVITPQEAVAILNNSQSGKAERVQELMQNGYPCYTTQVGKYQICLLLMS